MSRQAILIANSAKTDDKRTSVTSLIAKKNIDSIKRRLEDLGKYSFKSSVIIDESYKKAPTLMKDSIEKSSEKITDDREDCLLFYYFGHGVERNNDLHFCFKDSVASKLPTLLPFGDITKWIVGYGIKKTIFVIDCCFAGAATYELHTTMGPGFKYSLVASSVPLQRAHVLKGDSPFGAFSLNFFNGLRNNEAASSSNNNVTVRSLFDFTSSRLSQYGFEQTPYNKDGGLNSFILSAVEPQRFIIPSYNTKAARKSFYSKIWWIGSKMISKPNMTSSKLYGIVQREKPNEMLTPYRQGNRTVYQPVHQMTFDGYLHNMERLGIIHNDTTLSFTKNGLEMFVGNCARFNEIILDLIKEEFARANSSLEDIDLLIKDKIQSRGIPIVSEIYLDAKRQGNLIMELKWFGILLDLTGYSGYFRYASKKTFFPY